MVGQLLQERYEIVQVLGGGSFGQTYLAKDIKRAGHSQCVVKQLHPVNNAPQFLTTARRLFTKEAETLEKLGQHDRIPSLLAALEENQEFYLVQEFISGRPLTHEILPGQPWSEDRVISLLTEVLEILVFAHRHGANHQNIKPANLIRRQADGKIVLIDFGAVKALGAQMAQGQFIRTVVAGTPGYMPLEQLHGQPRLNSDIYALGMIAIQALSGMSADELARLQGADSPNTSQLLWRERVRVSAELAEVIDKMVLPGFLRRYQSASEALSDLKKIRVSFRMPALTPETTSSVSSVGSALQSAIKSAITSSAHKIRERLTWREGRFILAGTVALIAVGGLVAIVQPKLKARELYSQGLEKFTSGNRQGAFADFTQALQLNPKDAQIYYERGKVRFYLEEYPGAVEDWNKAIELNPNYADAYVLRCSAQRILGKYSEALGDCTQAVRLNPKDAEAYLNRGNTLYSLGDYKAAIEDYSRAIGIDPNDARFYSSLGAARNELRDYKGAIQEYNQALRRNPKYAEAYNGRGNVRATLGDKQGAIEDYTQAIRLRPKFANAYFNRGLIRAELGQESKAIEDFQQAAKIYSEQGLTSDYNRTQLQLTKLQQY
ncbi:MAG: tetratricopeptide repeat protein [Oscillatoria princeps RMCB-10]|jgi:serine/threonine protein kinase/regulator of sirC expression with transglutaminase-like and TPR domain|nr:tetratricopeptide repeat protein [Oscillatoria princeps RMCB-10]